MYTTSSSLRQRGGTLVGVLIFILIVSVLLAGVASFALSHQVSAQIDADWATALQLAEGGANTEFRKISLDESQADQSPTTYTFGNGSYTAWVTQRNADGTEQ